MVLKSNPMNLGQSGVIISTQLDGCNTLLTQLALIVDQLQNLVSPINSIQANDSKQAALDPLQAKWHCLLIDLKTVVLPEFYVVFNDPTTVDMGRRQLYDVTQAIYYALKRYLDASLYAHHSANSSTSSLTPASSVPDSYGSGQGKNALIATELHNLAQFITVDSITYIEQFTPYYTILIELDNLEQFLQSYSQQTLIEQLVDWQRARFIAFSVISAQTVAEHPSLLNTKLNHNLAKWVLRDILGSQHFPAVVSSESELITKPNQFKKGAALSLLGLGSAALIGTSVPLAIVMFLLSSSAAIISTKLIFPALNFQHYHKQIGTTTSYAMWLSFAALFLGAPWTFVAIYALCIASWTKTYNRNQQSLLSTSHLTIIGESQKIPSKAMLKNSFDPSQPLTLNGHAYHLGLLLSDEPTERLKQLIVATNELGNNLPYLQSTYPYLATKVRELIKDLTQNTIIRLDELASRFVEQGVINSEVQALFIRQHETRINALINLNLKQVKDLNATILEKKMAVFDDVGSSQERPFRDAIMELKILLRWLIAQQPDELQASSHQVILDNLESSTLKEMQAVFFDNHTTSEQRETLLSQVKTMLAHFKQQSPYALDVSSGHVDSVTQQTELDNLLQLSQPKNSRLANISRDKSVDLNASLAILGDDLIAQTKAQNFVAFNQAYINELIRYWH